jgi:hypothetical protein
MGRIKTPSRIQAEAEAEAVVPVYPMHATPSRTVVISVTVRMDTDIFQLLPTESRTERLFRLVAMEHPTVEVFSYVVRHVVAWEGESVALVHAHKDPADDKYKLGLCSMLAKHGRPDLLRELLCNLVDDNGLRRLMVMTPTIVMGRDGPSVWQGLTWNLSWNGSVALHEAVRSKDADSARLLLWWDGETQVLRQTEEGVTPLWLAVELDRAGHLDQDSGLDIVKVLLQFVPDEQVRQHLHGKLACG